MKTRKIFIYISIILIYSLVSCNKEKTREIKGFYELNKDSLEIELKRNVDTKSILAEGLIQKIVENAVVELKINGDTAKGVVFLMGNLSIINSPIIERNDSIFIKVDNSEAFLKPLKNGLIYKLKQAKSPLFLNKSNNNEFSKTVKEILDSKSNTTISNHNNTEKYLNSWKIGNYVDDFGDKTNKTFIYSVVKGKKNNSLGSSDIMVKTLIDNKNILFEFFDAELNTKELLPHSKFGTLIFKLPDGKIKESKIFFSDNSGFIDSKNNILYESLLKYNKPIKISVDLSSASDVYSDKFIFSIQRKNLPELLKKTMQETN